MRVLHLFDHGFATHEHAMRARLELGLADEGVRVFSALPESLADASADADELFSTSLHYRRAGPFTTRRSRASALIASLEERAPSGASERSVDVVHAFGGLVWEMAVEIGRQTGAAVVCEVWRSGLVQRARSMRSLAGQGVPAALAVPAEALARELQDLADLPVRVTPWGVSKPPPSTDTEPAHTLSIMISATGRDQPRLRAVIEAFAVFSSKHPGSLAFIDGAAADRAPVWTWIEELGLTDRVSIVGSFAEGRDLVLRGSALLAPEALGEYRSLLLDAMAAGVPIVAAADPRVDWLLDKQTAWIIEGTTSDAWAGTLERLLATDNSPNDTAQGLIASAREYAGQNHRMTGHVAAVLGLYESLLAEPTIPFVHAGRS